MSSTRSWRSSRAELATLKAAQQAELQQLERARDERQRCCASLTAAARTREQSLARLKSQQADLERLLRQLNRSLQIGRAARQRHSVFGRLRGQLTWPVAGQRDGRLRRYRAPAACRWDGHGDRHRSAMRRCGGVGRARGLRRLAAGAGAAGDRRSRRGLPEPLWPQ